MKPITFPPDIQDAVIFALSESYGYPINITVDDVSVPNPQSREDFVHEKVTEELLERAKVKVLQQRVDQAKTEIDAEFKIVKGA